MDRSETTWRLLDDPPARGAWNMAVDEALLELWQPGDPPILRLYGWSPPALSLGRFQPLADQVVPPGSELVRRLTGGAAIHHRADEVTYAVVAPYAQFGRRPRQAYETLHGWIAAALAALGAQAGPRGGGPRPATRVGRCFAHATDYDLVVDARKLVGSAQRRRRQAFLQHGSIPLSGDAAATGSTALRDWVDVDGAAVRAAIRAAFAAEGARLAPGALSVAERARAEDLATTRYESEAWTADIP